MIVKKSRDPPARSHTVASSRAAYYAAMARIKAKRLRRVYLDGFSLQTHHHNSGITV